MAGLVGWIPVRVPLFYAFGRHSAEARVDYRYSTHFGLVPALYAVFFRVKTADAAYG